MFLVNSRLGLITAALSRSFAFTLTEHPFSRSYGVILPSSLTRVLSRALGFSPHLPVSVYGTGTLTWLEAFLGSLESVTSVLRFPPHHISGLCRADLPTLPPTCLDVLFQSHASLILLRHPIAHSGFRWHWNFNQLSIAYALRPRLRSRLTLGGRAFPRKP